MIKKALINMGLFYWLNKGEKHMWNPETIHNLQLSSRQNAREVYAKFSKYVQNSNKQCNIRGLLDFVYQDNKLPLSKVESASEIVKRFSTGAMSFGSLSAEAHETLAIAMNAIGGKSNTGEGGEDPKALAIRY